MSSAVNDLELAITEYGIDNSGQDNVEVAVLFDQSLSAGFADFVNVYDARRRGDKNGRAPALLADVTAQVETVAIPAQNKVHKDKAEPNCIQQVHRLIVRADVSYLILGEYL